MMTVTRSVIGSVGLLAAVGLGLVAIAQPEPSASSGDSPSATTQPAKAQTPPSAASPAEAPSPPSPPSAEEVIEAFEKDRPENTAIQPVASEGGPTGKTDDEKAPKPRARYPDGYLLVNRTGRLTRESEWWILTFESDSKSFEELPMKLLPNRMLERAVYEAQGSPNVVFIVSGEVTDFNGENYLLLRKLLRRRDFGNIKK